MRKAYGKPLFCEKKFAVARKKIQFTEKEEYMTEWNNHSFDVDMDPYGLQPVCKESFTFLLFQIHGKQKTWTYLRGARPPILGPAHGPRLESARRSPARPAPPLLPR